MRAAAASTDDTAAHAASLALAHEPGEPGATAIDAVIAGVLGLAARHPNVLLGAGTLLLGGVGEGLRAVDGRARHAGLGAPRPRGFLDPLEVPIAARVAVPVLPLALALAHAGRGRRTLSSLAHLGVAAAGERCDPARARSLAAFGREGAAVFVTDSLRERLLAAAARSIGGNLTGEDLDAARAETVAARTLTIGSRAWAFAPWADALLGAFVETGDGTLVDAPTTVDASASEIVVIAACDTHGTVAIAAIARSTEGVPVEGTGLALPALAPPVMRGHTRAAPGTAVALEAPIGLADLGGRVDLAVGMGGTANEPLLAQVVRSLSRALSVDEALVQPRARRTLDAAGHATALLEERLDPAFGVVTGVFLDERGVGRAFVDPRRALTTA